MTSDPRNIGIIGKVRQFYIILASWLGWMAKFEGGLDGFNFEVSDFLSL